MAAFIRRFAKEQILPDRKADVRRDHWRSSGDRYPTGHAFHKHRQLPEVTKYGPPDFVSRRQAAATPAHPRLANAFAIARDLVVFIFAIAIALGGLTAVIITPPI